EASQLGAVRQDSARVVTPRDRSIGATAKEPEISSCGMAFAIARQDHFRRLAMASLINNGGMKTVPFAVASLAMLFTAAPASAELHGTCAGCSDNGTITPMAIDPPSFGFTASPDKGTPDSFLLEVLIPDTAPGAATETISITGTNT